MGRRLVLALTEHALVHLHFFLIRMCLRFVTIRWPQDLATLFKLNLTQPNLKA